MIQDDIKRFLLLTIATEIKKTKLKLRPVTGDMAIAIDFPEKLREIDHQFGAIQCYKENVELRFYFNALKDDLHNSNFFKIINEIDNKNELYRVKDRVDYIAFQFDEFDSNSINFIEYICKQVQKSFCQFSQKEYEELDYNFNELKYIFDLSIFKKGMFKGLSMQEAIQILKQQDSNFDAVIQSLQRFKQNNVESNIAVELIENNYIELESIVIVTPEQIEVTETERKQIIKGRVGQSSFKKDLLAIEKKCRLCGVNNERFLVASHIKLWSQSNNQERLDVNNGLLLCPNHDSVFDKGYISFDDDGLILISDSLDEATKVFLNINEIMNIRMNESQRQYMKWHRENLFKN
ncbi:HNH endonuclease [Peribacillus sp. Hz7]|uniref:HNH endonuclease n=1 Tax=Peribacillus sp. Hz7 TaxID=3344873 RepID=UPI0035CA70E4